MSFWGIIGLIVLAVLVMGLLSMVFHIFFMFLPILLIVALIIWLIRHFSKKNRPSTARPRSSAYTTWQEKRSTRTKRKQARNVKTKDVDD
ncbi:hypothetical protein [Lactobacillus sp. ESL0681]|uniref:hypothetical protein n=1 Tax=Lactobacillus sp. ESL0681 TaxID=2983211 RepID=UPI0023F7BFEC|nr:hypothetical protein [Lactobacillus sp. ESL0681]WEV40437.1 hypothetical protein OZX59_00545 [Lactobacillus sp. ESL0681]